MGGWIKSLWKDSLVYGIGYGVTRFLQIVILPIIAHALTLGEFGYYSNYVIFYTTAGGLFILGLDSAVARYFYESEDDKNHQQLFSSAFFFILLLAVISSIGFSFFSADIIHALGIPSLYSEPMPYVLMAIPAASLNGFFLSWFKWKRQKVYFLINSGACVVLLLVPLLAVNHVTFSYIFKVIFWSQLAAALMSVVFAGNYIRFYFRRSLMVSLLVYGFPWLLVFAFGISRTYLDRAFLTRYLSDDIYGLYNFSVRIATLLSLIITAFDMSFGPLAFSIWNKTGAPVFFARLQSVYIFLVSAIACAIAIASPLLIHLLGGLKYAGSEKIIPLLLFSAIPLSLINFSNLGTVYAKKSFLSTFCLFIGFAVVLLLNIMLTQRYLQYGATSASLVGHLCIIFTGYYLSNKYYKIPFAYAKDCFVFFFFFLFSILSVNLSITSGLYLNLFIKLIILGAVFFSFAVFVFPSESKKVFARAKAIM